jgi:hypothetical protein
MGGIVAPVSAIALSEGMLCGSGLIHFRSPNNLFYLWLLGIFEPLGYTCSFICEKLGVAGRAPGSPGAVTSEDFPVQSHPRSRREEGMGLPPRSVGCHRFLSRETAPDALRLPQRRPISVYNITMS